MNRTSSSDSPAVSASPLPSTRPSFALDDPEIVAALEKFRQALADGDQPDKEEILAQFPEIREALGACLDSIEFIDRIAPQLKRHTEESRGNSPEKIEQAAALGDFRIRREIGRGGMGVVYEAEQLSLGRRVALKMLPFAAVMDPRQLARFKTEAQAAAHLQHTNIVPVYAVGCDRGVYYYAMQYIEGRTLAEVIAQGRRVRDQRPGIGDQESGPRAQTSGQVSGDRAVGAAGAERSDAREPQCETLAEDQFPLSSAREGWGGPTLIWPANWLSVVSIRPRKLRRIPGRRSRYLSTHLQSLLPPDPCPPSATDTGAIAALSTEHSTQSPAYFRTVANLGIQAAEALDHAHERGVIHRDVKPGNLMLDLTGKLWITDFGLARIESNPGLTMTGDVLGTLRYMSPEVALGKRVMIDHRTDIYSLGVTLYELLALQPAFPGEDRQALLNKIATEEPRSLRRLNSAIPADLETIVAHAMAKEPGERYDSAMELADDLRRFLEHKSILAKRPPILVRAKKWVFRHQAIVTSAIVTGVVVIAISTVFVWRERSEAVRQRIEAEHQRALAQANLEKAREAVDRMLTRVGDEELAKIPQAPHVRRAVLEDALGCYQQFLDENPNDLSVLAETVRAYRRVGTIQAAIVQSDRSVKAFHRAIELLEEFLAKTPGTVENYLELATNHGELAMQLFWANRFAKVERERRKQLEHLHRAVELAPGEPSYQRRLATCYTDVGLSLRALSRTAEAESYMRQAVAIRRQLEEDFPGQNSEAGHSHLWLGALLFDLHHFEEAEQELKRAVQRGGGPQAENYLGRTQFTLGKFDESLATILHAVETRAATANESPYTVEDRRRLGWLYEAAADPLIALERFDEAETCLRRSLTLREQLVADFPERVMLRSALAWCYERLGILLYVTDRPDEAAEQFREATGAYESFLIESPGVLGVENLYARFRVSCPELEFRDSHRAIEIVNHLVAAAPENQAYLCTLGIALCRRGQ